MAFDFGLFAATVPDGWTVGEDGELIAVYPPDGDSHIQISTYVGPDGHAPNEVELWEFAEESLERNWRIGPASIRPDREGYRLDAEGPMDVGGGLVAFRLGPGQLIFATFYHSPESRGHLDAARQFMASIRPSSDTHRH
jgi:hypothetical protein